MLRVKPQTYIDTSVWCAFCFNEQEVPGAKDWLAHAGLDESATAVWTRTEFASAAAAKLRSSAPSNKRGKTAVNQAIKTMCDIAAQDKPFKRDVKVTPPIQQAEVKDKSNATNSLSK